MSDSEHVFTKVVDNKLQRCEREEADFVRVPIADYTSVEEWNNLFNAFQELKASTSVPEDSSNEETIEIPVEEYNGYQKAIRIVRDRAIQQIEKSKADEHGYTLLRADKRPYSHKYESMAWLITMSTPYSIKMGLKEVSFMLEKDLTDFYGLRKLPDIPETDYRGKPSFKTWYIKDFFSDLRYHKKDADRSSIQNESLLFKYEFLDSCDWELAFEISRIARNSATGCYEVSYWATSPM